MAGDHQALVGSVEVDFGAGDGPVSVHWRRQSIADWDRHEQAMKVGSTRAAIEAVFNRARTDAGLRMFRSESDRRRLENDFDPHAISAVFTAMCATDGAEGN